VSDAKQDDASAYNACLQQAKSKLPKAEFVPLDQSKINSMQDGTVAVVIGYKNEGKNGTSIATCRSSRTRRSR
jgi:hypothetical protein